MKQLLFAAMLLSACGAAAKPTAKPTTEPKSPFGKVAAPFRLPGATYNGSPPVIKDTTALRPTKPRGPVYLPIGAKNVARGKKVTSSDDYPIIGELQMLTDGDKQGTEGSWVELGPGRQWMQIDLGQAYAMHGILLWHYHGQARVYRDVIIQVSDDETFATNVRTVFNNDQDNTSGLGVGKDREFWEVAEGQWIPFAQTSRFVRFYSKGNTSDQQNQYTEAEVWASPVKTATVKPTAAKTITAKTPRKPIAKAPPSARDYRAIYPKKRRGPIALPSSATNVALGKRVTSSNQTPLSGDLLLLTDGNKEKSPSAILELARGKQWVQIDLSQTFALHGVLLWHQYGDERIYRDVVIQVADDQAFTQKVRTVFNNDFDNSLGLGVGRDREFYEMAEGRWIPFKEQARFVRFYSQGSNKDQINRYIEAEVWGSQPGPPPGMITAPFELPSATYTG